jgi:HPt (histidine-containing phosphotransfer) domain-containing protein
MPPDANPFVPRLHAEDLGGAPVLDAGVIASLHELGGGDDGLLCELIDLFLVDVQERAAALLSAADAGDLPAQAASAHALKSGSANLGALTLSSACGALEAAARDGRADEAAALVLRVGALLPEVRVALAALRVTRG